MKSLRPFRDRKRRTALLAWEVGAGFSHALNALGVVAHLAGNGVSCVFATADPRFEPWFRSHGARLVQTYLWPAMRIGAAAPEARDARTYLDLLANYGAVDPANLAAGIAHYDTIFDLVQPDIVLCENAFAAQLAARGRIPTIVYGSTLLFMPPVLGGRLAPIDASRPDAAWPELEALDAINAALGASARPPLSSPADLMDCQAIMPFGPAAFDPYAHARSARVLAPYCPDLQKVGYSREPGECFVYLHESTQFSHEVMRALNGLPRPVRLYIPALTAENRAILERTGVTVERGMLSLDDIAARATCLVHHGGVALTGAALALGVPQFILARFHDNATAGAFVAERRLGAWMWADAVGDDNVGRSVAALLGDPQLAMRAEEAAGEFRGWFDTDPTFEVAQRAASILGMRALRPNPVGGYRELAPI